MTCLHRRVCLWPAEFPYLDECYRVSRAVPQEVTCSRCPERGRCDPHADRLPCERETTIAVELRDGGRAKVRG